MKPFARGTLAILVLVVFCVALGAGYTAATGATARGDDRTPISLSPAERAHFREGMRVYLESIEGIIDGMTKHKMGLVVKNAGKSGMGMVGDVSLLTTLNLPPEFVMVSMDTHEKFDDLAKTASANGVSKLAVMEKLSGILANCTSCHDAYRLAPH